MFECARCGSSYSSQHVGVEHCPRCRLRDKVDSPLAFKAFDLSSLNPPSRAARSRSDGAQPPAPTRPA